MTKSCALLQVEKRWENTGKGSLWTIDHQARAGLVQQIRKTTMVPYSNSSASGAVEDKFALRTTDRKFFNWRDASGRFVPIPPDYGKTIPLVLLFDAPVM